MLPEIFSLHSQTCDVIQIIKYKQQEGKGFKETTAYFMLQQTIYSMQGVIFSQIFGRANSSTRGAIWAPIVYAYMELSHK
jgi:hypothetical protein